MAYKQYTNPKKSEAMNKGQGALEYLLLIGGAILVAVIVITILVGISGSSGDETLLATAHGLCAKYPDNECGSNIVQVRGQAYPCISLGASQCRATKAIAITDCGAVLSAGETYYLANDLPLAGGAFAGTCLTIGQNNVKLYCNNKIITTNSGSGSIYASGSNAVVSNCNIINNAVGGLGINLETGSGSILSGNKVNVFGTAIAIAATSASNLLQNNDTCVSPVSGREIFAGVGQNAASATSGNKCTACLDGGTGTICTGSTCQVTCT